MNELSTDLWAILLPEEWEAEQDGETIMIVDEDEVSIIEITPLMPEKGKSTKDLVKELVEKNATKKTLAEIPAMYQELEEDEMFWREWYLDCDYFVLAVSHGSDISNKNIDDSSVDDILSTLVLVK